MPRYAVWRWRLRRMVKDYRKAPPTHAQLTSRGPAK